MADGPGSASQLPATAVRNFFQWDKNPTGVTRGSRLSPPGGQ